MLCRLSIRNYLIIDRVDLDFSQGLTIITGETGAGKSILLDALSLALGERTDRSIYGSSTSKTIIEAEFSRASNDVIEFLKVHDLDESDTLLLRREVTAEGRSRSFINDTPVNLSLLKSIGDLLVDIHSQHETLFLKQPRFQLDTIDAFSEVTTAVVSYRKLFNQYRLLNSDLQKWNEAEQKSKQDMDYFRFQLNELEDAQLKPHEKEKLEEEYNRMTHAADIRKNVEEVIDALSIREDNALQSLKANLSLIQSVCKYNSELLPLFDRLKSSMVELKDIVNELQHIGESMEFDEEKIIQISDRLNTINRLEQKHRVNSTDELIGIKKNLEEKLSSIESIAERIGELEVEKQKIFNELLRQSEIISEKRKNGIKKAIASVKQNLAKVGLEKSLFEIEHTLIELQSLNEDGIDRVEFLFTANPGLPLKPVARTASGGELSRLMLCLKASISSIVRLPTLIFDEIDSGISGEVARKTGMLMKQLSKGQQVFAITHLPQIAARSDIHLHIYKRISKDKTVAMVKYLDKEDRVKEIASMISGETPSRLAIENARMLIEE